MAITGVTVPTVSTASSTGDASKLTANYETFLTLLTTQLRNQSPLEPTDANQFTQQLVQFSSIEQQIKMNSNLEEMKGAMAIANATSLVNYVGAIVTADTAQSTLQGGGTKWSFSVPKPASGTVTIKNASGEVVYQKPQEFDAGAEEFQWDGRSANGLPLADGTYTISFDLKDTDGNAVRPVTEITGKVDKLDFTSGQPYLTINGMSVSVWSVKSIKTAA